MELVDLEKSIQKSLDNSTLFCKIRNSMNALLEIAQKADNAELLSIYEVADILEYTATLEELEDNYDLFYNIFEEKREALL